MDDCRSVASVFRLNKKRASWTGLFQLLLTGIDQCFSNFSKKVGFIDTILNADLRSSKSSPSAAVQPTRYPNSFRVDSHNGYDL